MIKAISREAKYRLDFNAPGASDPAPPSSVVFQTLARALIAGWEINDSGGRSFGITYGGLPVMREDDLRRAFERLHAIEGECPDGNKVGCAEQVLRELGLE